MALQEPSHPSTPIYGKHKVGRAAAVGLGAKRLIDVQHLLSASADVAELELYGLPELIRFRLRAIYRLHQNQISNITIRTHEKDTFHISKKVLKDSLLTQALSSLISLTGKEIHKCL